MRPGEQPIVLRQGERALPYDLFEDVIVKLRFDGTLSKREQHAQLMRVWLAAQGAA